MLIMKLPVVTWFKHVSMCYYGVSVKVQLESENQMSKTTEAPATEVQTALTEQSKEAAEAAKLKHFNNLPDPVKA